MKHQAESPIKLQVTDANVVATEIGKDMGYSIKTPTSHLMSYDQFVKSASVNAPAATSEEKKSK